MGTVAGGLARALMIGVVLVGGGAFAAPSSAALATLAIAVLGETE